MFCCLNKQLKEIKEKIEYQNEDLFWNRRLQEMNYFTFYSLTECLLSITRHSIIQIQEMNLLYIKITLAMLQLTKVFYLYYYICFQKQKKISSEKIKLYFGIQLLFFIMITLQLVIILLIETQIYFTQFLYAGGVLDITFVFLLAERNLILNILKFPLTLIYTTIVFFLYIILILYNSTYLCDHSSNICKLNQIEFQIYEYQKIYSNQIAELIFALTNTFVFSLIQILRNHYQKKAYKNKMIQSQISARDTVLLSYIWNSSQIGMALIQEENLEDIAMNKYCQEKMEQVFKKYSKFLPNLMNESILFSAKESNSNPLMDQNKVDIKIKIIQIISSLCHKSSFYRQKNEIFNNIYSLFDYLEEKELNLQNYYFSLKLENKSNSSKEKYEFTIEPIQIHNEKYKLLLFKDVKKKQIMFRKQYQSSISQFDSQNQNIMGSISHKLKTPLNSVISYLTVNKLKFNLIQSATQDDQINRRIIENYIKPSLLNSKIQQYLIQDILDYVNLNTDQLKLQTDKLNLIQKLKELFELIQLQCNTKNIFLSIYLNDVPIENYQDEQKYQTLNMYRQVNITTDENKLMRILVNILNNAYRYTQVGGFIKVLVNHHQMQNQIQFKIIDSGYGMSEQNILNLNQQLKNPQLESKSSNNLKDSRSSRFLIFNPSGFENDIREDNKINQKNSQEQDQDGIIDLGISLKISNLLIKLLNHDNQSLSAQSQLGDGTSFTFQIYDYIEQIDSASKLKQNLIRQKSQSKLQIQSKKKSLQSLHQSFSFKKQQQDSPLMNEKNNQSLNLNDLQVNQEGEINNIKTIKSSQKQHYLKINKSDKKKSITIKRINDFDQRRKSIKQQTKITSQRREIKRFSSFINLQGQSQSSLSPILSKKELFKEVVVIVDDEPFNHESVKITLRQVRTIETINYYNGKECIDNIQNLTTKNKITAIIMDVDMPIMDGINATKHLQEMIESEQIPFIPIIGCTAHEDEATHEKCRQAGMTTVLIKPIFPKLLFEVFNQINDMSKEDDQFSKC